MGRFTTSILAISAMLVIVDIDCCWLHAQEERVAQGGNEASIVALSLPEASASGAQDANSPTMDSADSAESKPDGVAISSSPSTDSESGSPADANRESSGALENANPKNPTSANTSFSEAFFRNPLNLVLLVFVALYILLLFLPKQAKREQKALQLRLSNLKKNDRVILNSGIHGVVANINSDAGTVTLRVDESSNAKITVDRNAIRSVEA